MRVKHKGKPAFRWKGRGGRVVVGYPTKKPGRVRVEAACWYVEYRDHAGTVRRVKGFADRQATEAKMAELVRTAARIAAGLLPPEAARPRRSLTELLDLWRDHLAAAGTAKHAKTQRFRVGRLVAGVGAARASDLTPAKVKAWVARQRKDDPKRFGGASAGHYAGAVKAFTRWLCVTERCEPVDHLSGLVRETDRTDPRYERRTLPPDRFTRLVTAAAASGDVVRGLTGFERSVLYLTAASTGLRSAELASLAREGFDLAAATVTVAAAYSKNRRRDVLPLPAALVPHLRRLLARVGPGERVWPDRTGTTAHRWFDLGAEVLAHDLAAAGIPRVDAGGRVYDFHALRSQFATDLDDAGVSLPRIQRLMRHSVPSLTTRHYIRADAGDLAADVNRLDR